MAENKEIKLTKKKKKDHKEIIGAIFRNQIKLTQELLSLLENYSNATLEQNGLSAEIIAETKEAKETEREKDYNKIGELKNKIEVLKVQKKNFWSRIIRKLKENKEDLETLKLKVDE